MNATLLTRSPLSLLLASILGLAAGCAAAPDQTGAGNDDQQGAEIVNGTEATGHPEACVISFGNYLCSGSLIAPNVVLTAGHCVAGQTRWTVTCPYSHDTASVTASQGAVPANYPNADDTSREYIDDSLGSDIGLIRLDRALNETRVGHVRLGTVTTGLRVQALGRIHSGRATYKMYASPAFALTSYDTDHDYWASVDRTVIEAGDSGGPLEDTSTHEIVAVNSAGVDAAYCQRGQVCDQWAVLGAATTWFNNTMAQYTGGGASTPPTGCATATSCNACTGMPTCGWCNGRCVDGTASGGSTCTSAAGTWAWTSDQCSAQNSPPVANDACNSSTTCLACSQRANCGWCDGACRTGTASGPSAGSCTASPWAWVSSQCR